MIGVLVNTGRNVFGLAEVGALTVAFAIKGNKNNGCDNILSRATK